MLSGKKTYLAAIVIAAIAFAEAMGLIDAEQARTLEVLFGAAGLAALRAGVSSSSK